MAVTQNTDTSDVDGPENYLDEYVSISYEPAFLLKIEHTRILK